MLCTVGCMQHNSSCILPGLTLVCVLVLINACQVLRVESWAHYHVSQGVLRTQELVCRQYARSTSTSELHTLC